MGRSRRTQQSKRRGPGNSRYTPPKPRLDSVQVLDGVTLNGYAYVYPCNDPSCLGEHS